MLMLASRAIYPDEHSGPEGMVMTIGSAPVMTRRYKIRAATISSSYSELFALQVAPIYATVWYRCQLSELGIPMDTPPTIMVYQDSESTMIMALQWNAFKITKHLFCKGSFVKEIPVSNSMPADILTKSSKRSRSAKAFTDTACVQDDYNVTSGRRVVTRLFRYVDWYRY
jgi:hypothetical protein